MAVTIHATTLARGGAVVETSGGVKYAIFASANGRTLYVYKNIDGTPSLADSDTVTAIHGYTDYYLAWCHAAIDSNDDIHIVSQCSIDVGKDIAYAVFDCGTDTLGAWEEVAAYTEQEPLDQTGQLCQISIDSSDQPHIIYTDNVKISGGATDQIYYTWNDGSWQTPEQVNATAAKLVHMRNPSLTHCPSDDVEAFYFDDANDDPTYRRREIGVGWDTESEYTTATIASMVYYSVICTTGDTVYRYYSLVSDIRENDIDTSYNVSTTNKVASPTLDGTTRYLFFIDPDNDVHLISNDGGGWIDEGALQTGTFPRVIAQYSYLNNNQADELSYIFDDGTNVYYDSFSLAVEPFPPVPGRVHKDWRFPHIRM